MHLVLASGSPRRAELLRVAGFTFDTVLVDIDERARDGESPALYVRRLAAEKSAAGLVVVHGPSKAGHYRKEDRPAKISVVSGSSRTDDGSVVSGSSRTNVVILGADTVVVVDDEVLGKPRDDADAARMLRLLSGRQHEVLTGLSLRRGAYELGRVVTTLVEVTALSDRDISWYLASAEGRDKAGAYAIQGLASRFIPRIDGSYSNVVGLPVAAVHELLVDIASGSRSGYSDTRSIPRKSL